MRIGLVLLALVLFAAPAASASFAPPLLGLRSAVQTLPKAIQLSTTKIGKRPASSCIVHAVRSKGIAGRIERKLAPVACEQPPRSQLVGTGFFIRLAP
jgi:hypothetical protein